VQKRTTIGDSFAPYKKFVGLIIPEALARCLWLSPGAKLVDGRLTRYAGRNGKCHPAVATLWQPRIAKTCDSRPLAVCAEYPQLQQALTDYMMLPNDTDRTVPTDRIVVDVMHAARGASEQEVIEWLKYLRNERGLRPGTKNGPRTFRWFATTVGEHFYRNRANELVYADDPAKRPPISKDVFDELTGAIEII
jgi:hypothetical protein